VATTKYRRKKKTKVPAGYDSKLEYDLHNNELKDLDYHPSEKIHYAIPHFYEPDFVYQDSLKTVLVEVKGRFRDSAEARKYIYIRERLREEESLESPKQKELIFLFQEANKPMPNAKRRKDGSRNTHRNWAEKNGFRYYCLKEGLPKTWLTSLM